MNNYNDNRYDQNNILKKNSKRVLYITVGIAALFVAAISGTFAYFAASASNTNTIQGTIANTSLNLSITEINPTTTNVNRRSGSTNLIPYAVSHDSNNVSAQTSAITTSLSSSNECVDTRGFTACKVYEIKITLDANSPSMNIVGSLVLNNKTGSANNSQISNLSWTKMGTFTDSRSNSLYIKDVGFTASSYTLVPIGTTGYFTSASGDTLTSGTSGKSYYYYVYIWLNDPAPNGANPQTDSGEFVGTVTVNSGNGRITATFS